MPIDDPIFSSTALSYGTDSAYGVAGDPYDSSLVKVEPTLTQITQGLRPSRQIPAQQWNWVLSQFALIISGLISNDGAHEAELADHADELATHETRLDYWDDHSPRIRVIPYPSSGTWSPSARVISALAAGCGGGGAGGYGGLGTTSADQWKAGAGGGGGAIFGFAPIPVIDPSLTYNFDIGDGGPAPTAAGAAGPDGFDTILRIGSTPLVVFPGAQGGRGALGTHVNNGWAHFVQGGAPRRGMPFLTIGLAGQGIRVNRNSGFTFATNSILLLLQAAMGGYGGGGSDAQSLATGGAPNTFGNFPGGTPGGRGVDGDPDAEGGPDVTQRGGGGGGGGGAGPFGPGGRGGDGASQSLFAGAPENPARVAGTPPANSGAGGGGGGSAGWVPAGGVPVIDPEDEGTLYDYNKYPQPAPGAPGAKGMGFIITVEESA